MIDRLFLSALTFCLLVGYTAAIVSAWHETTRPTARPAASEVVMLPPVEVQVIRLPAVEVTGRWRPDSR